MGKTRKRNLLLVVAMALIAVFTCFFGVFTLKEDKQISASAETIEYQDLLGLEDRTSWGAHDGELYFGGVTLDPFGYFNTADSVSGAWYVGNDAIITANGGVDIMEYIYVNGVSARKLITDNVNGANLKNSCDCWLSNPAASPVYVETTNGSGILIKLLKSAVGDTVTITFKAGFSLIRNDGNTIYVSNDITYTYANGVLGGRTVAGGSGNEDVDSSEDINSSEDVDSSEGGSGNESTLDYDSYLGLEDRTSWASGGHADIVTLGIMDFSITEGAQYFKSSVNGCWYQGNNDVITANNGVDILQYVYLNDVSARDLLTENQTAQKSTANTGYWLSNPAAWPIALETGTDCWIRIDKTKFGGNFTFTFKAGFSLIRNDGETIYISNDISYTYANGVLSETSSVPSSFELSFEGLTETKTVKAGEAIGELPAVPEVEGKVALYWVIDGVQITADTVYNFGANKTAMPVYEQTYTLSFEGVEDTLTVNSGKAIGELPAVPEVESKIALGWAIDGVVITADTVYNYGADKTATPVYALEYQDLLGLEDRTSWGACNDGEYYFGGIDLGNNNAYFNTADSVCGTWHTDNSAIIAANNGVDIMEYIYVNGVSARKLITDNVSGANLTNSCGCWLSNPAASPVYVETTNASGIIIRLLKSAFGDTVTITFKAGFSIIRNDGEVIYVPNDIEYTYTNGILGKASCTLSFEGLTETKTLKTGEAIGELPAIPAIEGKVGVWQIDGVEIKAETLYNYGVNKTATLVYYEGTEISDTLDMANWGTAIGADSTYIRVGNWRDNDGNLMMSTAFDNVHWQDHVETASQNYGCDIMEYIYINGKSARAISTENGQTNAYGGEGKTTTFPFEYGGIYAPVDVYTNGNEFCILIMTDYVASEELVITIKAGFRIATSDGGMLYLAKDFVFPYYTVTFDGVVTRVMPNQTVQEPNAPTKEETESHTYAFEGWYNGDVKWDFDTPVTENLVLTAKFTETEKTKFAVTYNADNGTENAVVYVYTGASVKVEQIPADPEKSAEGATSYNFLYWSLDGENAYDFSAPVTEDITLTAVYTTKPLYTVTIGNDTVKVIEGGKVTKPADPTKESTAEYDYTFEAWYNGDVKWDFENDTVNGDLTLVAKYTESKRSYTISFNVTGNDNVTFDSVVVEYGTVYDLSTLLDGVDVTAYTYTVTVGGEAVTSVEVLSDVTVDVAFQAKKYYTVTVGGVEQTVEEGSKIAKPETAPTKESTAEYDYTFDGWYNGDVKWNFEDDTVTSDLELVAKYTETKRKYTVTFNVTGNDAIQLDPVEVEYGANYDLSKLLDGKDVSGYTYSISVGGVEKASIKVVGDVTVDVAFTKKADNNKENPSGGCKGSISGATGLIFGVMALGVVTLLKKKEN